MDCNDWSSSRLTDTQTGWYVIRDCLYTSQSQFSFQARYQSRRCQLSRLASCSIFHNQLDWILGWYREWSRDRGLHILFHLIYNAVSVLYWSWSKSNINVLLFTVKMYFLFDTTSSVCLLQFHQLISWGRQHFHSCPVATVRRICDTTSIVLMASASSATCPLSTAGWARGERMLTVHWCVWWSIYDHSDQADTTEHVVLVPPPFSDVGTPRLIDNN